MRDQFAQIRPAGEECASYRPDWPTLGVVRFDGQGTLRNLLGLDTTPQAAEESSEVVPTARCRWLHADRRPVGTRGRFRLSRLDEHGAEVIVT